MSETNELKLVFVGNTSVGKTCIVKKATTGIFNEESISTLGASYVSKLVTYQGREIRLQIWDTAGQERYRGMTPMYYRGAHVAFIIYSISDRSSFEDVDDWLESLRENADVDIIIFLVGNKYDLENERKVSTEEGEKKAEEIGAIFYEVSAKIGYGIDDLFKDICNYYFEKHFKKENGNKSNVLSIDDSNQQGKRNNCC